MKRRWLTVLIVVAGMLATVVLLLAILPLLVPTTGFRKLATEKLEQAFSAPVTVGRLSFRVLPHLQFTLRDVVVGKQLATAKTIEGTLAAWDLLRFRRITVLSLDVTEGKTTPNVPLTAEHLAIHIPHFDHLWRQGAAVQIIGAIHDAKSPNASMAGFLAVNRTTHEITATEWKGQFGDAEVSFDGTLSLLPTPTLRRWHVAWPRLTRTQLSFLAPSLAAELPQALTWTGPMTSDVTATRTENGWAITFQHDLSLAATTWGTFLTKGPNYPLKVTGTVNQDEAAYSFDDLQIAAGQAIVHFQGRVGRTADVPLELVVVARDFDAQALKVYLPWLPPAEELVHPSLELTVSTADPARSMTGKLAADTLRIQGLVLGKIAADFELAQDLLTINRAEGMLAGGKVSGTGTILFGPIPEYTFDVVADTIDAARFTGVVGRVAGSASAVVKLGAKGDTAVGIGNTLVNEGTIVIGEGQLTEPSLSENLFSDPWWEALSPFLAAPPTDEIKAAFSGLAPDVKDLKVLYRLAVTGFEVSSLTFSHPAYDIQLAFRLGIDDALEGTGTMWLKRDLAQKLLADPLFFKAATDKEGKLTIPFLIKGTGGTPTITPELEKIVAALQVAKEKSTIKPPAPPKPAVTPKPVQPKAAAPQVPQAKKPVITAPTNPPADEESMMKVQVGK